MSKKGLFASLIISCVLTLSLGIYTLVSVFGGSNPTNPEGPTNTTINLAFRTKDIVAELADYSNEDIVFTCEEGMTNPLKLNEETGKYEAVSAGEVTAVVTLDEKGNTKTFVIKVYEQGNGSQEKPHIIANLGHLVELRDIVNTASAERNIPANIKLVADIDLGNENWKPIGRQGVDTEYTGTFDGNGHSIKNLTISVNQSNYQEFISVSNSAGENRAFLDLGLFGKVSNAKILNLNVDNATINVSNDIYTVITEELKPDFAEFDKVVRITVGTIAGSAYNTEIVGAEGNSKIVSRFNAFSCANTSQAHGMGGVVGVAQLVRVSNYSVKVNITNNVEAVKGSVIGGVFGASYSSYNSAYTLTQSADHKTVVDNVEVDFASTLSYKNQAAVGGIIGKANNTGITNSTVKAFKVVDNTSRKFVDYTLANVTTVGGIASQVRTSNPVMEEFVSNVENVNVKNIDVFMLGGDVAGAIVYVGDNYKENNGLKESMTVKDVTVSGSIVANLVGGFAWRVNPGATVSYTKAFENPVVDVNIKAHMSAGFTFVNYGVIQGFETEVEVPASEGVAATTKVVKTQINVNTTGMGALIEGELTAEKVANARETTYAVGFVSLASTQESLLGTYESKISNFDIIFKASESINYAGIAFETERVSIENVSVNADFTSYNYNENEGNHSTTYMVSGGVCEAGVATTLKNVNVVIYVNKNITDKTLKYGATFFGGLVARYAGDVEGSEGLNVQNCTVSGDVYFNYSDENVVIGGNTYNVFAAGGLIGAIASKEGSVENVDALGIASIEDTANSILSNKVENLKITVDIKDESMGNQGYRAKGVGALVGVLNVDDSYTLPVLDLSSNTVSGVEIAADDTTFTYSYTREGGAVVSNITLGANKQNSYGSSYAWNTETADRVTNPEEIDVTYKAI